MNTDQNGNIYINHEGGISYFNEDAKQWKTFQLNYQQSAGEYRNYTKSIIFDQQQQAYFLAPNGIGHLKNQQIEYWENDCFIDNPHSSYMMEFVGEDIWIFSTIYENVFCVRNQQTIPIKNTYLNQILKDRKVTNIKFLEDQKLWICTYSGIIRYDVERDEAQLFYPNYGFSNCIIDREGNYWLSSLQNGLFRIPDLENLVWNMESEALEREYINKIDASDQHVYFAEKNGSIYQINTKDYDIHKLHQNAGRDIQCFKYISEDNRIYFVMDFSLKYLSRSKVFTFQANVGSLKYMEKLEHEYVLLSSLGSFIYNHSFNQLYELNSEWGRYSFYDSSSKNLWIASNNGLWLYQKKDERWTEVNHYLANTQILSVDFDRQNQILYILTFNGRILQINSNLQIEEVDQIVDNTQVYVIKWNNDKLYIGTNQGIKVLNLKTSQWQEYNTNNGLLSNIIENFVIRDSFLWIASNKGLQKFPVNKESTYKEALLYLDKIEIGDLKMQVPEFIKLDYKQTLKLFPEVSFYSSNGDFTYAYRVLNHHQDWIKIKAHKDPLIIPNLPYGQFEMELKVVDGQNQDSSNTILLSGYVRPPFWLNWWFILSVFALMALTIYKISKNKLEEKKRQLDMLYELNTSKLTAIKSQMNPHFIFNVLNSIKSYIYENDKRKAIRYLEDFSDLMRQTLNMSEHSFITLEEEIELIKVYIELEAMLLFSDFKYNIDIDEQVDIAETMIPALLLQPYIENAFKHGLRAKEGAKTLDILFKKPEFGGLQIEIIDNGVGREKSGEYSQSYASKHKSFATKAMKKRIELINQEGKSKIEINVVDLYNKNKQSTGTKVVIVYQDQN